MTLSLYIIAGEPSGDRLGAALMRALKAETGADVVFRGVGGVAMAEEGLQSLFPMTDIAVMGLAEILPRLPLLMRRISETAADLAAAPPDALITIDSPGFNSRVASRLKAARPDTPVIHYVAPSVWAWRPGRARKMAAHVDHVLALLPFEPPWFTRVGLSCDFVGHPVIERAAATPAGEGDLRERLKIAAGAPVLVVAPGSRVGEIRRLATPFGGAVARLVDQRPDLVPVVPVTETVTELVETAVRDWPAPARMLHQDGASPAAHEQVKYQLFRMADAALAASGTVTLELAAMGTPSVVGYKASKLTEFMLRRLMTVDTGSLLNVVAGRKAMPELFQDHCEPVALADAVAGILPGGDGRDAQLSVVDQVMRDLGAGGTPPSIRAARSVLGFLGRRGLT